MIDYAKVPSLRCYVLLEQTLVAATVFRRGAGDSWTASAHTVGEIALADLAIALPLADLYNGLTFADERPLYALTIGHAPSDSGRNASSAGVVPISL